MNHPTPEEWVPYVFGEAKPETRRQLKAHLGECAECRGEIQRWERSLSRLNLWKLPRIPRPMRSFTPFLRWVAAATVVVLLAGFGLGRVTAKADVQQIRAALEPELRRALAEQLRQELRHEIARSAADTLAAANQQTDQGLAELARAVETARAEDKSVTDAALKKLDSQSFAQFVALKKQLDTVAVNAAAELRDTQQGLFQLAGYTRPSSQ